MIVVWINKSNTSCNLSECGNGVRNGDKRHIKINDRRGLDIHFCCDELRVQNQGVCL